MAPSPPDSPEPHRPSAVYRILDANANRAAEALRVVEDYCRFELDHAGLALRCKQARHRLASWIQQLPAGERLAARDTPGDVGTELSTDEEERRSSAADVCRANLKRAQQALRVLEEYAKVLETPIGSPCQELRYEVYALERSLVRHETDSALWDAARLYVLIDGRDSMAALDDLVEQVVDGGADAVQLRDKRLPDRQLLERAERIAERLERTDVLFVVNDRADVARLCRADGLHVGREELDVASARKIVPAACAVGVSTHDLSQLRQAQRDGADYVGCGPIFASGTKSFAEYPGLKFLGEASREAAVPYFAIGGITLERIPEVVAAGCRRIAVHGAVCNAPRPARAVQALREALLNGAE